MHIHQTSPFPVPEGELGICCWEAASTDGESCSCWMPILHPMPALDPDGKPVLEEGPADLRRKQCGDCAFRKDSPERQAIDGDRLPYGPDRPFICHERVDGYPDDPSGMPRVTVWVHPPSGKTMKVTEDDYMPVTRQDRAWMADSSPAPLCAGWGNANQIRKQPRRPQEAGSTDV